MKIIQVWFLESVIQQFVTSFWTISVLRFSSDMIALLWIALNRLAMAPKWVIANVFDSSSSSFFSPLIPVGWFGGGKLVDYRRISALLVHKFLSERLLDGLLLGCRPRTSWTRTSWTAMKIVDIAGIEGFSFVFGILPPNSGVLNWGFRALLRLWAWESFCRPFLWVKPSLSYKVQSPPIAQILVWSEIHWRKTRPYPFLYYGGYINRTTQHRFMGYECVA